MKVTKISYGETMPHPMKAYASLRPEFTVEVGDGEDPMEAVLMAKKLCHEAVSKTLEIEAERVATLESLESLRMLVRKEKRQLQKAKERWDEFHKAINYYDKELNPAAVEVTDPEENDGDDDDQPNDDEIYPM